MKKILKSLTRISILVISGLMVSHGDLRLKADPVEDIAPHVVSFNILSQDNDRYATGFHFKWNDEVFIMTNKHVCDLHRQVYKHDHIQFEDYIGKIIEIDYEHDLCLVTSNREDGLEIASRGLDLLEEVILVGFPRGNNLTIRKGHIYDSEPIYAGWIGNGLYSTQHISTITYGGNSGSPVTNIYGEVIGVLFAGSPLYVTEGLIVPHYDLVHFIERVLGERE